MIPALRIAIIGTSGSGKTTLSRRIGAALGLPIIELDAINWQADWRDLNSHEPETFRARVAEAAAAPGWVSDGNYGKHALPILLARATDIVWLDYARSLVMARVIRRSFARAATRREIWPGTGNREYFRDWLDPTHPIRWAWATHASYRDEFGTLARTVPADVTVHHLRRGRDADALVDMLRAEAGQSGAQPLAG
jgi:hypothetical protein